ncbi:MAG: hypothetical protein E7467_04570 [Ruminococcaceae bacterium]|nr:hypothetical protein [Oscillospiraceae bacterium]
MILTILIASLCACGLFMILWAIVEAVLLRLPNETVCICYLHGTDAEVEQKMRACLCLRRQGVRLLFVDCGLSAEAQVTAQLMIGRDESMHLCSPLQIYDYIRWENGCLGAGTH